MGVEYNNSNARYFIIKLCFIFLFLAYFFFIIRYFIGNFVFLYSLDDLFWEMSGIFFLKYIFFNKEKLFYISSTSFFLLVILEEYSQKYFMNNIGIFSTTYSFDDILSYIFGFVLSLIINYVIVNRWRGKGVN